MERGKTPPLNCVIKQGVKKDKQMKKLAIVAVAAAVFAGCTSVEITREGSYNDAQLKMEDISENPYHIDWDVAPARVEGVGSSTCWCWFFASTDGRSYSAPGFTFDSAVSAAKDAATYDAVEKAQSDALLGCMYRVTKTSKWLGFYKETKAEVKGFPANVKSIELNKDRPVLVDKDLQIIRLPSWEKLSTK
jgi:hypothetical protein